MACRLRRRRYDAAMPASAPSSPPAFIALPPARLTLGVTGHRNSNAAFARNHAAIDVALTALFDTIDAAVAGQAEAWAPTRLHALLAHGADLLAVERASARGWPVTAPLPFGPALNIAINAHPATAADARALLAGAVPDDAGVAARAAEMQRLAGRVQCLALAEQDATVAQLYLAMLEAPGDAAAAAAYGGIASERVAAAGQIMVEQSDLLIAIWDGVTPGTAGGTRHTIAAALDHGAPVIWIDAADPARRCILRAPESLLVRNTAASDADIAALLHGLLNPPEAAMDARAISFHSEQWHPRSSRRFHAYRRVEALFGGRGPGKALAGLVQSYETPDAIATGSAAPFLASAAALPGGDAGYLGHIEARILCRFAWADGLSTYLSDAYRGGMVTNFMLSALAIIGGVAYLPFATSDTKWPFALFELLLLLAILAITNVGRRRRWHGRWFETRRVAEYLRHAPLLLLLGVARPPGRWPRGSETMWPETYARRVLRDLGLPPVTMNQAYLRDALGELLAVHVRAQRTYHATKAKRLTTVHHRLDHASELMFKLAVTAVALYLLLVLGGKLGVVTPGLVYSASKSFTFLGVALPALGGAFAGIRYFGDFERFAAISEVTAEKLEAIEERLSVLLGDPDCELRYAEAAALARAMDDVVIAEIESWQAVFAGKQIAVPV
jgi:hypothetical protein